MSHKCCDTTMKFSLLKKAVRDSGNIRRKLNSFHIKKEIISLHSNRNNVNRNNFNLIPYSAIADDAFREIKVLQFSFFISKHFCVIKSNVCLTNSVDVAYLSNFF